jgi:hypothetical protein
VLPLVLLLVAWAGLAVVCVLIVAFIAAAGCLVLFVAGTCGLHCELMSAMTIKRSSFYHVRAILVIILDAHTLICTIVENCGTLLV